jgi:hypothetical protein
MGGQTARVSALAGGHGWLQARRAACRRVRHHRSHRGIVGVRGSPEPPMPSCRHAWRMASVLPAALPRGQEDGAFVGRAPFSSRPSRRRVTRGCGGAERRRSPPATVLPSARRRGWEDRQRASARWQEGMGGSRRAAPPAAGCAITDRIAGSAACAGLPSYACPPAAVLAHGVCPPSRAGARPGGRCFCWPCAFFFALFAASRDTRLRQR